MFESVAVFVAESVALSLLDWDSELLAAEVGVASELVSESLALPVGTVLESLSVWESLSVLVLLADPELVVVKVASVTVLLEGAVLFVSPSGLRPQARARNAGRRRWASRVRICQGSMPRSSLRSRICARPGQECKAE